MGLIPPWSRDEALAREVAEAALSWFNRQLDQAELSDAIDPAGPTEGLCDPFGRVSR